MKIRARAIGKAILYLLTIMYTISVCFVITVGIDWDSNNFWDLYFALYTCAVGVFVILFPISRFIEALIEDSTFTIGRK